MTDLQFYWHINHDMLLGCSANIQERIDFIRSFKPAEEVGIRLWLMKPVQGELPAAVVRAGAERHRAWAECNKPWAERNNVWAEHDKALAEYNKTLSDNAIAIEALHRQECPDCPWNGHTIFPEAP